MTNQNPQFYLPFSILFHTLDDPIENFCRREDRKSYMTTETSVTSEKTFLSTNTYKGMSGICLWGKERSIIVFYITLINNKTLHLISALV